MKKILPMLLLLGAFCLHAQAQDDAKQPEREKRMQEIEALKVAFISRELELTPEDAQKFWPVYNQYNKELTTAYQRNENVIDREEKVLEVRKKYKGQLTSVLGEQRMNRMFQAEGRFHEVLINVMRRHKQMRGPDWKDGKGRGPGGPGGPPDGPDGPRRPGPRRPNRPI
jgi:hypothetical protein